MSPLFPKKPVTPGPTGTPNFVGTGAKANAPVTPTPKKRSKTRTGKKIDKKTGKIVTPKKGRLISAGDGKVRQVTAADVAAATTTELPATPVTPTAPRSSGRATVYRGSVAPIRKGARQGKFVQIQALTTHATKLLGRMQETRGTDEYHDHHADFNMVHAALGQMSPEIHGILGLAKGFVHNPSEKSAQGLIETQKALHARLAIIRSVEADRQTRRDENRTQGDSQ